MRLLVFGGAGQLGLELLSRAHDLNFDVAAPVISELDISDERAVADFVQRWKPEVVINAAAYTAVDKAEVDKDLAYRVNQGGAKAVARALVPTQARLIHISTDYVFAGTGHEPLRPEDPVAPASVYGASKLAGERDVTAALADRALIVRTSSLHGKHGENFVHTMLKLFAERDVVKVVSDQVMSPTWAGWLAEAVLDLSRVVMSRSGATGIVHAAHRGALSWFDFAQAIQEFATPPADAPGGNWRARLERTTVKELGRPAPRPMYSVMDVSRLEALLSRPVPDWQYGLKSHLRDIGRLREGL